jgi:hypothetical protein
MSKRRYKPYKRRVTEGPYTVRGYDENGKCLLVLDLDQAASVRDAREQTATKLRSTEQGAALLTLVKHLQAVKLVVKVPKRRGRPPGS